MLGITVITTMTTSITIINFLIIILFPIILFLLFLNNSLSMIKEHSVKKPVEIIRSHSLEN